MRIFGWIKSIIASIFIWIIKTYYTTFDVFFQKIKLRNYETDIKSVTDLGLHHDSNKYAVFIYYEPQGAVSLSVRNVVNALNARSINVLVVCNHELSETQQAFFTSNADKLIHRGNKGFDFGGYKDGIKYLKDNQISPTRLLLLNDSVYYFNRGLENFIEKLDGSDDTIASFENWDAHHEYHLQSFAMSVSNRVFKSKAFSKFWKQYIPISNRIYAIEKGEKKLSDALRKSSISIEVIYTADKLTTVIEKTTTSDFLSNSIAAPLALRKGLKLNPKLFHRKITEAHKKYIVVDQVQKRMETLCKGAPNHTGWYYFSQVGAPIVKKDLVFRGQFRFWEVEHLVSKIYDPNEVAEYLSMLRTKGEIANLTFRRRIKANVGAA